MTPLDLFCYVVALAAGLIVFALALVVAGALVGWALRLVRERR